SWLDCLIEPYMVVELASPVVGVIDSITVDRGSVIKTGQVVAILQSEIELANVKVARARLEFNQRKYLRSEELFKKELLSSHEKDLAETEKKIAETELHRSKELLNMRTIKSPISGVVVERFVSPGELTRQEKILKIAQINPLNVEVIAPVEMFGTISPGMGAKVKTEDVVGSTYRARVKVIDRVVDAASGTFGVRLELPNPRRQIPAGIKCKVRFE
ncbi:MAG: efflux RND transporter periplasmic adaptor subunit, partial [Acidiferrobacterales bacterium]